MGIEQTYLVGIANQWFWIGLITGTSIGIGLSALMRWITESRG
jgi:hypothetical protein